MAITFSANAITVSGDHAGILSEARATLGDANVLTRIENALYALSYEIQARAKTQLYQDLESLPPEEQEAIKLQIESAKGAKAVAAPPEPAKTAAPAKPTRAARKPTGAK